MSALANRIRRQFAGLDIAFLTDSTLLSVGIAIARVLGFGFSFVLARRLSPDTFGFIQYTITLGGIIAIGTQPFVQHVLARYIAVTKDDAEQLSRTLHAAWMVLAGLIALTLLVSVPLLLGSEQFNIGTLVIFLGLTFFYSYYGLARGYMASRLLLAAYLGSNVVQIVAIFLLYQIGSTQSPTPALLIYGLSYLVPVIALQIWQPLPVYFRFRLPDKKIALALIRFSAPIWVSHAAYIFYAGMDLLLLERFTDTATVGRYALTKTLTMLFGFVPVGLVTILLPKVASQPSNKHAELLRNTMMIALAANVVALLAFVLGYRWFVSTFFGISYIIPIEVMLMMAFAEILFGFHGIITAVLVGSNNPQLEMISRILIVVMALCLGWLLIPLFGMSGAAVMLLCSGIVALFTYVSAAVLYRRRQSYVLTQN